MPNDTRTYRFTLTVDVEPGHPAYDDPEWAADAAWGSLTNEYGLRTIFSDIEEVPPSKVQWRFAFQRGVTVASSSQLGLPA